MTRYVVGTVDEFPPGARKIVTIARRSVGIFNVNDSLYAIRNQCPHAGGELCRGTISGFLRSDGPGRYEYLMPGEMIRCPWHGWEFEIATGRSWFDPASTRVATYQASVESGQALAESPDVTVADAADSEVGTNLRQAGLQPGPYRTEMYDVEVDQDFVVVHL